MNYVLVIGGSSGIGASIVRVLGNANLCSIVTYSKNKQSASEVANRYGGLCVRLDLSNEKSIDEFNDYIALNFNDHKILGVILCAALMPSLDSIREVKSEDLRLQYQVSVIGPQKVINDVITKFFKKDKRGFIYCISSAGISNEGIPQVKEMSAYLLAKSAQKNLLNLFAKEYPWLKIRFAHPSFTRTRMLDIFDPRYLELLADKMPILEPEDVANLIVKEILHEFI